jgi:hypothetical protein
MVYAVGVDVEDVFNFIDCTVVGGVSQIETQTYTVSSVGVGVDFIFPCFVPFVMVQSERCSYSPYMYCCALPYLFQ